MLFGQQWQTKELRSKNGKLTARRPAIVIAAVDNSLTLTVL